MKDQNSASGYRYISAADSPGHAYLFPTVKEELDAIHKRVGNAPLPLRPRLRLRADYWSV